jgi:hypothetical protein|tara:strand:+ start:456 stop:1220 length:765 start_codon:yes stop_codon:yes gene_type:complete
MTILNEGGNIFKTPEGESATTRIMQADVLPTVEWLEGVTNLELTDNMLGTTGKKETSGDLDLAVDVTKMSKAELEAKLTDYVTTNNMQGIPKEWVRKTGISVHFKTPIKGDDSNGFVQTDFMFGNPDWMKFSLQGGGPNSPYKGMHRHILLSSIAKTKGMKWSANEGLKDRETNELVSNDPNQIAKTLLGQTASPSTLETVESIVNYIKKLPNYDDLVADAVDAFARDGLTLPDNKQVETYQANWMRRMIDSVK